MLTQVTAISTQSVAPLRQRKSPDSPTWRPDPIPLHALLDGPSNRDWDSFLQHAVFREQSSEENHSRPENSTESGPVCPVHGVVHGPDDRITPLDQVERPRDDEVPGAPQLPSWRRPVPSVSSPWQELPTSVGLSDSRRPMASLWDTMVSASLVSFSSTMLTCLKHSPELTHSDRPTTQPRSGGSNLQATGSDGDSNREANRRISSQLRSMRRRELEAMDEWERALGLPRRLPLPRNGPRGRPFGDYMVSAVPLH